MASLVKAHSEGHLDDRLAFYAKPKLAWKYASAEGGDAYTSLRVSGCGSFPG